MGPRGCLCSFKSVMVVAGSSYSPPSGDAGWRGLCSWLGTGHATLGERSHPGPPRMEAGFSSQAGQGLTETLAGLGHCCTLPRDEPWWASRGRGWCNAHRKRPRHRAGAVDRGRWENLPEPRPPAPGSSKECGSLALFLCLLTLSFFPFLSFVYFLFLK